MEIKNNQLILDLDDVVYYNLRLPTYPVVAHMSLECIAHIHPFLISNWLDGKTEPIPYTHYKITKCKACGGLGKHINRDYRAECGNCQGKGFYKTEVKD